MKVAFVACVVLCALAAVQGRQLQQKTFPTVAAALEANKADLSTLAAAIKVCGCDLSAMWSVLRRSHPDSC
jgi:hypothetical protein